MRRRGFASLTIPKLFAGLVGLILVCLVTVVNGACQPGYYTGASPSQMGILTRTCLKCPAGRYTNTEAARECTTCEVGKFGPTSAMKTCIDWYVPSVLFCSLSLARLFVDVLHFFFNKYSWRPLLQSTRKIRADER